MGCGPTGSINMTAIEIKCVHLEEDTIEDALKQLRGVSSLLCSDNMCEDSWVIMHIIYLKQIKKRYAAKSRGGSCLTSE